MEKINIKKICDLPPATFHLLLDIYDFSRLSYRLRRYNDINLEVGELIEQNRKEFYEHYKQQQHHQQHNQNAQPS